MKIQKNYLLQKIKINFLDGHKLIMGLFQNLSCNLRLFHIIIHYQHYKSYNSLQIPFKKKQIKKRKRKNF